MVVEQNRDCRIDQVRKNSLGSISFTTSFRSNLPSPREDRLVLFTMATCVYRNASGHASLNSLREFLRLWSRIPILMWTNGIQWSCLMIRWLLWTSLLVVLSHHRNLSVIYIVENLFRQGKGSPSISLNSHYFGAIQESTRQIANLGSGQAKCGKDKIWGRPWCGGGQFYYFFDI